jgi:hypothetical protein
VMNAIDEVDFLGFSYGYRPGRILASISGPALARHYPRQEPGAVIPHAGICAGGAR